MEDCIPTAEARAQATREMPLFIAKNKDKEPVKLNYPDFHKKDYENGGKFEALGLVFYILPYKRVIEQSGKVCKDNYVQFDDGKLEVFDSRTRLNTLIKRRR